MTKRNERVKNTTMAEKEDKVKSGSDSKDLREALRSPETLREYLEGRACKHEQYKKYGRKEEIQTIQEKHYLYLTSPKDWNDIRDREHFQKEGVEYFAKCFSFSKSENVAMWMLYADTPPSSKGFMIDLTKAMMDAICQSKKIAIGEWDRDAGTRYVEKNSVPIEREHIALRFSDIIYYAEEDGSARCSRKQVEGAARESLRDCMQFVKDYPWMYENECRLVAEISQDTIRRYGKEKIDFVRIAFELNERSGNALKNRIYQSPRVTEADQVEYGRKSSLKGSIAWDLCGNCAKK